MKAMLIIVFVMSGHTISSQGVPMLTLEGCRAESQQLQRPLTSAPENTVIPGLVITSFCVEQK